MDGIASFRATMTEEQRLERNKIDLPYLKAQHTGPTSPGTSRILYHPDEGDDYDAEDPDADLDI